MITIIVYCVIAYIACSLLCLIINECTDSERVTRILRYGIREGVRLNVLEKKIKKRVQELTGKLSRGGVVVLNIPFEPEEKEIFYIENHYDEQRNLYIKENMEMIKEVFAKQGYTFIYLPSVSVKKEVARRMLAYYTAGRDALPDSYDETQGLRSDFLLDYMLRPENREKVKAGFAWCNKKINLFNYKKFVYYFEYISFDGADARLHPRVTIEAILTEIEKGEDIRDAFLSCEVVPSKDEENHNLDEATRQLLEEVEAKLRTVRLKGISEAVIAKYVKPCPELSRVTIGGDFTINLNDYDNTVITMEPIVKAVYILFMRHEEGIYFKNLHDYQVELEIIYRAVKAKKNDVDKRINEGFTPQISNSVRCLTDPLNNSINEKCTRIKEAFLLHYHDSIAQNYYVRGGRADRKRVTLPRNLVTWEEEV